MGGIYRACRGSDLDHLQRALDGDQCFTQRRRHSQSEKKIDQYNDRSPLTDWILCDHQNRGRFDQFRIWNCRRQFVILIRRSSLRGTKQSNRLFGPDCHTSFAMTDHYLLFV